MYTNANSLGNKQDEFRCRAEDIMEAMELDFDPETLLTSTSSDPMLGKPADQPPASSHEQQAQQSAPSGSFIVLQSGASPGGGGSSGGVTQLGNISVSSLAPGQGARAAASRLTAVMGRAAGSAPGSLTKFIISPGQTVSSAPVRMLGTSSAVRVAAPTQLQPGTPGTITLSAAQAAQMGILSPRKLATMDGGRPAAVGLASPKRIVVRSSPQGKLQGSVAAAAAAGTGSAAVAQPYRVLTQNTLQQQVANANRAQQGVQFVRVMGTAAGQTVYSAPHTVQSSHPAPATVTAPTAVKIAIAPGGRAPAQGQRLLLPAGPISGTGTGTAAGATAMSSMAGADMMRSTTASAEYGRPRPMMHAPRMNRPATTTNRAQKASSVHLARAAARGGAGDNATQIRPRKPCNCTKSQCLKLYCDCFASGEFCNNCNCTNCFNSLDREEERQRAIRACLDRNPFAFKPKIGKSDNETRKHQKGCNCKKSGCLKNYCECYEAKIFCSSQCKCMGCKNYESANTRPPRSGSAVSALDDSLSLLPGAPEPSNISSGGGGGGPSGRGTRRAGGLKVATFPATERAPAAVRVTQDVISATLSCLMTEAAGGATPTGGAAGQEDTAAAQRRVLREFGRCLSEIIGYGTRRQESAVPGLV